jgi:hypothetical protein
MSEIVSDDKNRTLNYPSIMVAIMDQAIQDLNGNDASKHLSAAELLFLQDEECKEECRPIVGKMQCICCVFDRHDMDTVENVWYRRLTSGGRVNAWTALKLAGYNIKQWCEVSQPGERN